MKHVSWVLALVVGAAIGFFAKSSLVGQYARPAPAAAPRAARPAEDAKAVFKVPVGDSPVQGPADALVTFVEVSDFECPYCRRAAPTVHQLQQAFAGQVRFVFKQFPLPMHQNAVPAALLAEEARAEKGDAGFWAIHDALFDQAQRLDGPSLRTLAAAQGLDAAKTEAALSSQAGMPRIRTEQQQMTGAGVNGTPTFFINGRKVVGDQGFAGFKAIIEEEQAKARVLVASGVPASQVYEAVMAKAGTAAPAPAPAAAPPRAAPPPPPAFQKVDVRPDDPLRGPADAPLTIVLFSDFQCPYCSRVAPTLKQVEEAFPGKVRLIWKHQPLPFHDHARPAALLAEAAREQGKFWPLHDLFFAGQADLSQAALDKMAAQAGVDLGKARSAAAQARAGARIDEDMAEGKSVGATGTPAMFFNCRFVSGAQPFEALRAVAESELQKAEALLARGAKRGPGFYAKACEAAIASAPAAPTLTIRPDDPVRGNPSAPVTVTVFSDFQCPFCSRVKPTLDQVEAAYGGKVRIVWKHKPLSFHNNAMPAALAAEAAREQGKFWPMHDKLFAGQKELSSEAYERWASELGLDLTRFRASIASPRTRARIEEDEALSTGLGINGTPALFVNGEQVQGGAVPFEVLKATIDRKLTAAR